MINESVELITDPVTTTTTVANGMGINPIFDWQPIMGIPLWLPIAIMLAFGCILVWFYWLRRVSIFRAVAGWKESAMKATQTDMQTWIVSRTQKLTIACMWSKDNILSSYDPMDISMYHINSGAGIIRVGGIPGAVVSEDFDQNRDFITECALTYNCDLFNQNQEMLKKQFKETQEKNKVAVQHQVVKPITDAETYEEYGRQCLEATNPYGLPYPSYSMWDPQKWRKYFPRGCSGMFFGGELLHDARKLNLKRKQKGFWEVHAFLAGAIGIGMIALLVAWLFPMGA